MSIYVRSSEADSVQFCSTEWIRRDVRYCLLAFCAFKSWLFKISHASNMLSIIHIHMRNPNSSPLSDVLSCARVSCRAATYTYRTHLVCTLPSCCMSRSHRIRFSQHSCVECGEFILNSTTSFLISRLMKYEYEVGPPKNTLYTREIWASWRATRMFKTQNTCHPTAAPSSSSFAENGVEAS